MQLKMAKASDEDIQQVIGFFHLIEEFMEYGTHTPCNDEEEEESIELDDAAFVERLRALWGRRFGPSLVDSAWCRVVHGYQILRDNCCDPAADTLEVRPDWAAILEAVDHGRALAASVDQTDAGEESETSNG